MTVPEHLTVRAAAEYLHRSERTVRRLIAVGQLETVPGSRPLMVTRESITRYIETHGGLRR